MANEKAVEMFVGGLVLDPNTQAPVVILKDESGDVNLPIWIGVAEATSIASAIKQINMARPLTHDLMNSAFNELGVRVQRVIITELRDATYFAELILSAGDKALILDARPSDAIAMAIRASAPIFVAQSVLEQARVNLVQSEQGKEGEQDSEKDAASPANRDFSVIDKDKWDEILEKLDPDDFKYKM